MDNKHEFAIYYADLFRWSLRTGDVIELKDDQLVNRIRNILRLEPNESIILFDSTHHCTATITTVKKTSISIKVNSSSISTLLWPRITMLLPILKREAMEQSWAAMCELGVTDVQPVTTAKSQQNWDDSKDIVRAKKIMGAAAEQSKQFALPSVLPELPLDLALSSYPKADRIFFDAEGEPLKDYLDRVPFSREKHFLCLVGPEGDLTAEEKQAVKDAGFTFVKLTPTVLRSWQAAFLGIGILRSYLSFSQEDH